MVCRLSHHSRATLSDIQVHFSFLFYIHYDIRYTIHIITHYYITPSVLSIICYTLVNIIFDLFINFDENLEKYHDQSNNCAINKEIAVLHIVETLTFWTLDTPITVKIQQKLLMILMNFSLHTQEPYLDVPEAATYELSSCYNVTIECRSGDMLAKIRTSKLFDGKVYAKGAPKSCAIDVKNALEFELQMPYQDIECNVRQNGLGRYMNDVVIQHHDTIVTSSDLGLAVTCQYDLTNKTVSNEVDLGITGDIEPALSEEVIVDSPNVVMKITARDGADVMRSAEVGDPLTLQFEILDPHSPYEMLVRELVAMDGSDNAEITLIDSRGCPTDHFIMGPIYKSAQSGKILLSQFDAFKFPSSEVVQFRALVTPCMPTCEPVQCDQEDLSGGLRSIISYGRKRRSVNMTGVYL